MTDPNSPVRSVLRHVDAQELREATRRESRARQRHLPPISVYRWWARRTETVTGAIIDAVNRDRPGRLLVADTFAGGGVIALAALLRGHRVYAQDVNPWAARSLKTMLSLPAPDEISVAAQRLHDAVADLLDRAYATTFADGTPATVAHTLRVATSPCPGCSRTLRLFPTALVTLLERVDCGGRTGYLACPAGHLNVGPADKRSKCGTCGRYVTPTARYTTGRIAKCVECRWSGPISTLATDHGLDWQIVLVERTSRSRREIGPPTPVEAAAADTRSWSPRRALPEIAPGIETSVLIRHGMRHWHDLYPPRQRVLIEALLESCKPAAAGNDTVARALQAAVLGSTEMAGHASRWDPRYLKAYETVASHRFNFTTFAVEPNVWGAPTSGRGTVNRRLDHLAKASLWLEERLGRRLTVEGPLLAQSRRTRLPGVVDVRLVTGSSQRLCIPAASFDAVVTDPPYHDDVHYGELSDLFRAWSNETTGPLTGDAVVRGSKGPSGTAAYQTLLTDVFREARRALHADGHLVLSYANRQPAAWVALFSALQTAGFRAVGYTVVHSENETDHSKTGRRACNLDVLIDLIPHDNRRVVQYAPELDPQTPEESFCHLVGRWALRIGDLDGDWTHAFAAEARSSTFLVPRT